MAIPNELKYISSRDDCAHWVQRGLRATLAKPGGRFADKVREIGSADDNAGNF